MDKTQDALDLYFLTRNVQWRYRLDQYEDATIAEMLKTVRSAVSEIKREIFDGDAPTNADELVAELEGLSAGLRKKIGEDVATMSGVAAEYSATEHASIMSLDGRVPINTVALSAAQFQSFLGGANGGTPLPQWVDDAWGHVVSDKIKRNLNIAVLRGEGYQNAVRGLLDSTIADFTEREAVTIARTYVQTANVAAQMAVYQANDDLVRGWKWSAVLEPGYSKSGRGTCIRCQALDSREFKLGEGPHIPLHARCRCIARPVTKSWRELGIDRDEIEQAIRPYTIRPDQNIDAGGMRTIIESGRHQGDYASWWAKQPKAFQVNAVGPGRWELLKSGKIQFGDLVDANGRQRTIAELMGGKFTTPSSPNLVERFVPAKTIKEAEAWAIKNNIAGKVDYGKLKDVDVANEINRKIQSLTEEYGSPFDKVSVVNRKSNGWDHTPMACRTRLWAGELWDQELVINQGYFGKFQSIDSINDDILQSNKNKWWSAKDIGDMVSHEYGHKLTDFNLAKLRAETPNFDIKNRAIFDYEKLGRYAATSLDETLAEIFARHAQGEPLPVEYIDLFNKFSKVKIK